MEDITISFDERIVMRDGVRLSATVYRPARRGAPSACLLTLTPYIADRYHEQGRYFAASGLPFAIVNSRGRGNSEGTFRPYRQEAQDGHDSIEWLARQPYCNGRVGMWGGSYGGYAQWATAQERPSGLCSIAPTASPWLGLDFPMRGNISYPYVLRWIALTQGRTAQNNIFADQVFWARAIRHWIESGASYHRLDTAAGLPSSLFQEWIAHPQLDHYWESYNPSDEGYGRINIPVLTITGSYDDDQLGALEHYRRHLRTSAAAGQNHYLVIGPWDHLRTGTSSRSFGGMVFGQDSAVDLSKLRRDWYAWTMEDGARPEFLRNRVAYYVMGAESWRYANALEDVTARHERYFLDFEPHSEVQGRLQSQSGRGGPARYVHDPRDTQAPEIEAELRADPESLTDQTLTAALGGQALMYESAAFGKPMELAGFFRLQAWISIDTPDTDLYVTLYELLPSGAALRLTSDAIRARYRESLRVPRLVCSDQPLLYDFHRFNFVARRLAVGSRLRLVIAPVGHLVDASFWQVNFNMGGIVSQETKEEGRPVTVMVFHDALHTSALHVPIGAHGEIGHD